MTYDFDRIIDRRCTNDLKWRPESVEAYLSVPVPDDMIPMWLADMDFACPPSLIQALKNRCDKEILGYCSPGEGFYRSICFWQKERHGFTVEPQWITFFPSVVAGINCAVRAFTKEGDGVIIQQPVYDPFAAVVSRTGRRVVNNALKNVGGYYTMDYELLEEQVGDPKNKLMILCSPHNPVGRVWSAEELIRCADLCMAAGVRLVVDEIHSDLVLEGHIHHPLPALKEEYEDNVILLTSPGKTFNIAGLKAAYSIIPNPEIRKAMEEQILKLSLDVRNTFGIEAVEAAYTKENEVWLTELLAYIQKNIDFTAEFAASRLPGVTFYKPEGTYLLWLDFTGTGMKDQELMENLVLKTGVMCISGTWFGPGGENHLRFNAAAPRSIIENALERFAAVLGTECR